MTNYTVKELFWFYLERLKALQALEDDIRLFLNRKITATELRQRLEKRREGLPAQKTKYMGMKKLKCKKCGSERFTGDVFYNTEIKLYEKGGFDIVSDLDAEQQTRHG